MPWVISESWGISSPKSWMCSLVALISDVLSFQVLQMRVLLYRQSLGNLTDIFTHNATLHSTVTASCTLIAQGMNRKSLYFLELARILYYLELKLQEKPWIMMNVHLQKDYIIVGILTAPLRSAVKIPDKNPKRN